MQSSCRLMGKKLLVSLAMEGKFTQDGLQGLEEDDDTLTAMARELVTEKGIGEAVGCGIPAVANALKFGSRPPSVRPIRRKDESAPDAQFSLF